MSRALLIRCFLLLCLSVSFLPGASGCGGGGGGNDDGGDNTPDVECNVDNDCPSSKVCEDNFCVAGPECTPDSQCNEGFECVNEECVEAGPQPGTEGGECGGNMNIQCGVALLCDFSEVSDNSCPANMTGFCRNASQPMSVCDRGAPVECGCDGTLYANACTRGDAGVARAAAEFCQPGGLGNSGLND